MSKSYLHMIKLSIFFSLILPPVLTLLNDVALRDSLQIPIGRRVAFISITAILSLGILRLFKFIENHIDLSSKQQATYLDRMDIRYVDMAIFLSSGMSLFLELAVIRWQSSIFPVFALYKNYLKRMGSIRISS